MRKRQRRRSRCTLFQHCARLRATKVGAWGQTPGRAFILVAALRDGAEGLVVNDVCFAGSVVIAGGGSVVPSN